MPSSPVQACITGPLSDERGEGRGQGADADGVGLSHRYRVGNYKSWTEECKQRVGDFGLEWGRK